MFADIAPSYDRANAVLSLGVHGRWRRRAVTESGAKAGDRVLDCATGTGDLAFLFARTVAPGGSVVGTDFCAPMVDLARVKAKEPKHAHLPASFEVADALDLPFDDDAFDAASIAFGIRNVDDPVKGLAEMARVVKPGGRVVVLEFGQPRGFMGPPFRFYSRHVMPRIGGLISGNREAYEYLPETSARFPAGDRFLALMDDAKAFSARRAVPLTSGIAYVYVGTVR